MDTIGAFHYGPAVIVVCSVGALTVAGVLWVCAYIITAKTALK